MNNSRGQSRADSPRKGKSAFLYFVEAKKYEYLKANPKADHDDLLNKLSEEWESLRPSEKKPYIILANKDNERYAKGMEDREIERKRNNDLAFLNYLEIHQQKYRRLNPDLTYLEIMGKVAKDWSELREKDKEAYFLYTPVERLATPSGSDSYQTYDSKGFTKKTSKEINNNEDVIKSPPKRAKSAYMFYVEERELSYKLCNPELSHWDIVTKLSNEWNELDPEEKSRFESLARKDKERYDRQLKEQQEALKIKQSTRQDPTPKEPKEKAPSIRGYVPKQPKSAFVYYVEAKKLECMKTYPNLDHVHIIAKLNTEWDQLDIDDKAPFHNYAKLDKHRYQREMEAYERARKLEDKYILIDHENRESVKPPRKPKSAFLFYFEGYEDEIKCINPDLNHLQILSKAATQWDEVEECERKPFYILEQKDLERYQKDIELFRANKKKDYDAAFLYYVEAHEYDYKRQYPDLNHLQIVGKLGKQWAELEDSEKIPYLELLLKDKKEESPTKTPTISNKNSVKTINPKNSRDSLKEINSNNDESPEFQIYINSPKKSKSAFFFFVDAMEHAFKQMNPEASHLNMISRLSKDWAELPSREKEKYINLANNDRIRYYKELDEYETASKRLDNKHSNRNILVVE